MLTRRFWTAGWGAVSQMGTARVLKMVLLGTWVGSCLIVGGMLVHLQMTGIDFDALLPICLEFHE